MKRIINLIVWIIFSLSAACGPAAIPTATAPISQSPVPSGTLAEPTATVDSTATQTPTQANTPTATLQASQNPLSTTTLPTGWERSTSDGLRISIGYPTGWQVNDLTTCCGFGFALSDSTKGMEGSFFSTHPFIYISRLTDGILIPKDLPSYMQTLGANEISTPEPVVIDGQPGYTTLFTLSQNGLTAKGRMDVVRDHGVITQIFSASSADSWEKNQEILQQVRDTLTIESAEQWEIPPVVPAALSDPMQGLLPAEYTINGFVPVSRAQFFDTKRSEWDLNWQMDHFDPAMAGAEVDLVQGYFNAATNNNLYINSSKPLTAAQIKVIDTLLANPQKLANAVNQDPSDLEPKTGDTTYQLIASADGIGEKSQGLSLSVNASVEGGLLEVLIFRRGATLVMLRHQFQKTSSISQAELLKIARQADANLQAQFKTRPELAAPAAATTGSDPALAWINQVAASNFTLPQGYKVEMEKGSNFVTKRLAVYGGRLRMANSYSLPDKFNSAESTELVGLYIVYPLDATERETLDWIIQNPAAMAEYFTQVITGRLYNGFLSFNSNYSLLPAEFQPVGLGDHAGGIRLKNSSDMGDDQDVIMMRYNQMLLVASVEQGSDSQFSAANVSTLAGQLYSAVDSATKGKPLGPTPTPGPTPFTKPSPSMSVSLGDFGKISDLDISPDGKYIAFSKYDYSIKADATQLVDLNTGRTINSIPSGFTGQFAFSPDGKLLAANGWDKIILWDVPGLTQHGEIIAVKNLRFFAFSPDSKTLASSADGVIQFWDIQTGKLASTLVSGAGYVSSLAFAPNGNVVISAKEFGIRFIDPASQKVVTQLDTGAASISVGDFPNEGDTIQISLDGRWLAFASVNRVQVWDFNANPAVRVMDLVPTPIPFITLSPDGRVLVVGFNNWGNDPNPLALWDIQTGQRLPVDIIATAPLAITPDSHLLITQAYAVEGQAGQLLVWKIK